MAIRCRADGEYSEIVDLPVGAAGPSVPLLRLFLLALLEVNSKGARLRNDSERPEVRIL